MPNRTPIVESGDDGDHTLFVKDGAPVKFCFHQSVTQGRGQIMRDVERHGGKIVSDERRANVLLVDEEQDLELLRRSYYSSTEAHRLSLYVEPRGFVRACLRAGRYRHVGPRQKGMPGRARAERRGGRTRVAFTEEDREHLAYYLATRFPTRDGRMGNKGYKELEQLGQTDDPTWEWARRHTWSSWREHYKIHPDVMDVRIDRHLRELKDTGHHHGHDPRSHGDRDVRQAQREEDEEDENDENGEEQAERQRQRQRQRAEKQKDRERRQADRPVTAVPRRRVETARKKGPPVSDDSDENMQDEEDEERPQRVKRHRVQSDASLKDGLPGSSARRACPPEASSSRGRAPLVEQEQEESEERQGKQAENRGRVQGDRPTAVVQQQPPETAREQDPLVCDDGDEDVQDEEGKGRSQPVKGQYSPSDANRQYESPNSPVKRAHVMEASLSSQGRLSGVEADRAHSDSKGEEDSGAERSLEIEGSDLFGDREYGSQPESDENSGNDLFGDREYGSQPNFDSAQDFDSAMWFPPQTPTRPIPEQDGLPMSTQETLVPSSPFVEKELNLVPIPTPSNVAEAPVAQVAMTSPPSSQRTLVVSQERVVVQRAHVRGTSVQPGPSVPKKAGTRGVAAASDAPYRNTRARSRSIEPQSHLGADSQPARLQGDQSSKEKRKGKEKAKEVLAPIEEDMDVDEEQYDEGAVRRLPESNSLNTQDEMSVEALLENEMSLQDEDEESDDDIMLDLPRFQEVEIEGEPSDSDDAETHKTLVRGSVQQEFSASEEESGSSQDQDEDEDDAARIEQMASGTLRNRPSGLTRSMAASQEISPRRTRSGSQASKAPHVFPSPGTKARAVVDRFREDERKMPYAPPMGSRAAKALKGKGKGQ